VTTVTTVTTRGAVGPPGTQTIYCKILFSLNSRQAQYDFHCNSKTKVGAGGLTKEEKRLLHKKEREMEDEKLEKVQRTVHLMDDTVKKVACTVKTDLEELGVKLAQQLSVTTNPHEFSFFQITEGLDSHRLLPDHANVSQLFEKWESLFEATRRMSKILWKRRYLKPVEELNPSDIFHAHLVTRQARLEHLRYPLPEKNSMIAACGAAICLLEYTNWKKHLTQGSLTDDEVRLLIPGAILVANQELSLRDWNDLIMKSWKKTFRYHLKKGICSYY